MGWKEDFNQALLRFVQDYPDIDDAVEVTDFEQEHREGFRYNTWTQDSSYTVIMITYKGSDGRRKTLEWTGDFWELMTKLTEEPTE